MAATQSRISHSTLETNTLPRFFGVEPADFAVIHVDPLRFSGDSRGIHGTVKRSHRQTQNGEVPTWNPVKASAAATLSRISDSTLEMNGSPSSFGGERADFAGIHGKLRGFMRDS